MWDAAWARPELAFVTSSYVPPSRSWSMWLYGIPGDLGNMAERSGSAVHPVESAII